MYKQLIRVGNSLAVVIDKPTRALLGIAPETLLRIWTDGRRLVLEPENEPRAVTPAEELTIRQIVHELIDLHGLSRDHVAVIHGMAQPPFSQMLAVGWADGLANNATERDVAILRRYHACLQSRRAGVPWATTIERVALEFPLPARGGGAS